MREGGREGVYVCVCRYENVNHVNVCARLTDDKVHRRLRIRNCGTKFTAAESSLCPSSGSKEDAKNSSRALNERVPQKLPEAVTMITRHF